MQRQCRVLRLLNGRLTPYISAWRMQKALMEDMHLLRRAESPYSEALVLVEHPNVFTLGRGADPVHILSPSVHASAIRVERGGEVTYHGPGQLVAYPILDLGRHKKDLHWYVRTLEQIVIDTLTQHGVQGERSSVNSGVWVGQDKVCAVGITASRWITMHGLAINVCCDLDQFKHIVPCGIEAAGRGVTSINRLQPSRAVSVEEVADTFVDIFSRTLQLDLVPDEDLRALERIQAQFPELAEAQPNIVR